MVCLSRPYHFNFFKGCLLETLLGPFLYTLTQNTDQTSLINISMFFKGTLIQIYVHIKAIPSKFNSIPLIHILKILELFTRKVVNFFKIGLDVCKQLFHICHVRISHKIKSEMMWNLRPIILMWRWSYRQSFITRLAYL